MCCGLKGWERDECEVSTDKYRDGCLFGLPFFGFLAPALAYLLVSGIVLCWSAGRVCKLALDHLGTSLILEIRHSYIGQARHATPRHAPLLLGDVACGNVTPPSAQPLPPNQQSLISCTLSLASIAAMVQGDYDLLLEMGFDAERADLAVKKTKGRRSRGLC